MCRRLNPSTQPTAFFSQCGGTYSLHVCKSRAQAYQRCKSSDSCLLSLLTSVLHKAGAFLHMPVIPAGIPELKALPAGTSITRKDDGAVFHYPAELLPQQ